MKSLFFLIYMLMIPSSLLAGSLNCELSFGKLALFDEKDEAHPELKTLTPDIPKKARLEISYSGDCDSEVELSASVYGLKGEYISNPQSQHSSHTQAPTKSKWTKKALWTTKMKFKSSQEDQLLQLRDIELERFLLSVSDGMWYWSLKFEISLNEVNSKDFINKTTFEIPSPLVH